MLEKCRGYQGLEIVDEEISGAGLRRGKSVGRVGKEEIPSGRIHRKRLYNRNSL